MNAIKSIATAIKPNPLLKINEIVDLNRPFKWIEYDTAILVVHGIGNQLPMETIDQFGKGLVKQLKACYERTTGQSFFEHFVVEHVIVNKKADEGARDWFDNVVRIRKRDDLTAPAIDIYEYYWAYYTEGKADWSDINQWLQGVVKGADKFYKRNMDFAKAAGDRSLLTYYQGQTNWKYFLFIRLIAQVVVGGRLLIDFIVKLLSLVPVLGSLIGSFVSNYITREKNAIANILGDVIVYNVTDTKSKYYAVRREILDGAVRAIKFLLEKKKSVAEAVQCFEQDAYPSVIVAGHSLGSQVSYDALNRINFLINKNGIKCRSVGDKLKGFVTFGCPLDKIAFFLRENIPDEQFVRQQLLNNFLGFKQKDWNAGVVQPEDFFQIENTLVKNLEQVKWRNYYDEKDYVSGNLDYYSGLTNIDCQFDRKGFFAFTHGDYWTCDLFYQDFIIEFLS